MDTAVTSDAATSLRVTLIYVAQRRHILYLPSYLNLMPNANVSGKRKINVFACFGDATVDMS